MSSGKRSGRKPLRELLRLRYPDLDKDQIFALLASGRVRVDGELQRSGSVPIPVTADISIAEADTAAGGRGRFKLEAALAAWEISPAGMVWLDAGASTGGFTACLLDLGATAVHAVDVGYNQLDYRLRTDARVHVWERCNIMEPRRYDPRPDAFCMDLSFRSALRPVLTVLPLCRQHRGIVLLKPQFEWQDPPDWFDGVVPADCLDEIVAAAVRDWEEAGIQVDRIMPSPVTGRHGNQEFLVLVSAGPAALADS
ncbi:SAM-dependent methyltransferase [Spirochaeta africana]|uniref:Putative rRNA methylase n=1 Tax=Spirochaeta africana (strain ATCC 700263 / DSM 8902 / Z-7692) TaxID=889378 RepID=H9UKI2_SPIAZ|nr:SAM-dependent methyltransferase [Spirochaeta africana]AFG38025.1 putative rRNA methylase [Spirochaeta africana DSM 8902]